MVKKSFHIIKESVWPFNDSCAGPVRSWSHEARKKTYHGPRTIKFIKEPQIF